MDGLLLENGDDLLLEDGTRLLLQEGGIPATSGDIQWVLYLVPNWELELGAKWDTRAVDAKWSMGAPNL